MTPTQLLNDLDRRGIHVEASGNRLRYAPRSLVTPDILDQMRYYKSDLLGILNGRSSSVRCPWCRSRRLVEGRAGRIWCIECEEVAWWVQEDGEIVWADCMEEEIVDPDLLDPCPDCGSLEQWQSVAGDLQGQTPGGWDCLHCAPPTKARELRERAARSRAQES